MKFEILKNVRVIVKDSPINLEKGKIIELDSELDIKNLLRVGYIKEEKEPSEREKLIAEANELGLEFAKNIGNQKLQELINEAKAESDSDDNLINSAN